MVAIDGFDTLLNLLLRGNVDEVLEIVFADVKSGLFDCLACNRDYILEMLAVAVLAAFFTNLTSAFTGELLGEQGFYVAFLMMFALAVQAFSSFYSIGEELVENIVEAMKLMLPAYAIAVTGCCGSCSGTAAYELIYIVLGCIEYFILYVLFPCIQIYFLFQFVNELNKEQYFTRWLSMLKDVISWSLKVISIFVVGMHLIQGLVSPMIDAVKVGSIQKGISALPGGSFVAAFTGIFLGCSALIKNCIGVVGILVLFGIAAVPFMQMLIIVFLYKLLGALLEPVIDKRLSRALAGVHASGTLLLRVCFVAVMLLIVSIAMIAACTNSLIYTG